MRKEKRTGTRRDWRRLRRAKKEGGEKQPGRGGSHLCVLCACVWMEWDRGTISVILKCALGWA